MDSENTANSEIVFTTAALLEFLLNIDELSDYEIGVGETLDGNIQVSVGDSTYVVDCSNADDVEVPGEAVDEVSDISDQAYSDLLDDPEMQPDPGMDAEDINGGVLKEIAKTFAVGGLARLNGKAVREWL